MKTNHVIALLFLVLSGAAVCAQNDTITQPTYQQPHYNGVDFTDELPILRLGAGVWLPQGRLSNSFAPSPMFEIALDFSNGKQLRSVEFVMQFILPEQEQDFIYNTEAGRFTASSNLILNGLLKLKKPVYTRGASSLELGVGIGISAMFVTENDINFDDEVPYESANTILFTPGLSWYHRFRDESVLTLGADLNIAPYTVTGAQVDKIGAIAVVPKITYRF